MSVNDEAVIDRTFILWSVESLSSVLKDPVYSSHPIRWANKPQRVNSRLTHQNTTWQPNIQHSSLCFNRNKFALLLASHFPCLSNSRLTRLALLNYIIPFAQQKKEFCARDVHKRLMPLCIGAFRIIFLRNEILLIAFLARLICYMVLPHYCAVHLKEMYFNITAYIFLYKYILLVFH